MSNRRHAMSDAEYKRRTERLSALAAADGETAKSEEDSAMDGRGPRGW